MSVSVSPVSVPQKNPLVTYPLRPYDTNYTSPTSTTHVRVKNQTPRGHGRHASTEEEAQESQKYRKKGKRHSRPQSRPAMKTPGRGGVTRAQASGGPSRAYCRPTGGYTRSWRGRRKGGNSGGLAYCKVTTAPLFEFCLKFNL